ncbi:MAG: type I pullulanase [Lachnospiraceae bacterium]|nr:type I pullulanase [Lachnospiraceae bacterium]
MKSRQFRSILLAALLLAGILLLGACGKKPVESSAPEPVQTTADSPAQTQSQTEAPTEAPTEPADEGPDDVPIRLEPAGNVVDRYTKDETDYASMPLADTKTVRLHYRRNDDTGNDRSSYAPWNVWAWDMTNGGNGAAYEFTGYDDYGVYADLDLMLISGGQEISKLGFIVRTDSWSKDPDGDRSIDILPQTAGGIQNVYVRTTESTVFDTQENALKSIVNYTMLRDSKTINVYFKPLTNEFRSYSPRFSVTVNGEPYTDFTMGTYDTSLKMVTLNLKDDIDICDTVTVAYRFDPTWTNQVELMMTNYFDTDEFNERYGYDGDDLGVTFDNEENVRTTTFKVWAPTSSQVLLRIYNTGDYMNDKTPAAEFPMQKEDKGVFALTVPDDLDGKYYTYVVTNSKGTNEVVDPYAKSAGINGRRGMVVNFTKLNASLAGWAEDARPFEGSAVDAVIYEAHVRDMTISPTSGVEEQYRGKFLGLAQSGTTYTEDGVTVSTGLDHIKELGITHIQLQPFYDYSSVDETRSGNEMSKDNYNWGYDPLNYNVLEGSYSTDPYDGYNRILEFKQMVMAMHAQGISINMDVVYNHTSASENSNLNLLVPYYYYRTKANGTFYNGSGCGNELASERKMVNKFFRDSCKFWIDEYHLSGFRFDLMGLIDNQTMIDIYKDCQALYPSIMIYGEPWTGGTSKLKAGTSDTKLTGQTTVQASLAQDYFGGNDVLVGAFNDVIRNAVRGENNPAKGFVQGSSANASLIAMCIAGRFSKETVKTQAINPNQVLNYVSCHDNYTLYDQLIQTMNEDRLPVAYLQAEAIIFLAEGVPFIQEGEEFLRSKLDPDTGKYEGNSYNVGDFINVMDYSLKIKNADICGKVEELIELRKACAEFRLATRAEISEKLSDVTFTNGNIVYSVDDLTVIHSLLGTKITLDGEYEILFSNVREEYGTVSGELEIRTNESIVLRKAD